MEELTQMGVGAVQEEFADRPLQLRAIPLPPRPSRPRPLDARAGDYVVVGIVPVQNLRVRDGSKVALNLRIISS